MSEPKVPIDVDAFTTKVGRSRAITRWVIGDGRFSYDTSLVQLSDAIYQVETNIRNGLELTCGIGSLSEGYMPLTRSEKVRRGRSLSGWTQMTLSDLLGSNDL